MNKKKMEFEKKWGYGVPVEAKKGKIKLCQNLTK